MAAIKQDIVNWLEEGKRLNATHMLVICDDWDYEDFPVYVFEGQNARDILQDKITKGGMLRLMKCYSFKLDLEEQLAEHRVQNFD